MRDHAIDVMDALDGATRGGHAPFGRSGRAVRPRSPAAPPRAGAPAPIDPPAPACAVLPFRRGEPDMAERLRALLAEAPDAVVVVIAHDCEIDARQAVALMRAGAFDVLVQPIEAGALAARLEEADAEARRRAAQSREQAAAAALLARLTPRETDVAAELVAGASNKLAARSLGLSPRTVEFHRARIFEKLEIGGVAALAHIALTAQRALEWRMPVASAA